jgi:DNA-binding response OmpR family regulator
MNRVLIIEDEAHLAEGLRFNLEEEGYAADVAETGERGLELLSGPRGFDVVVLDVMLPGKSGFEVAAELRAAGNFVPVLMLTARSRPEDVLQGFASGADDYLSKPFELAILMARIQGLLRRAQWAAQQRERDVFRFAGRTVDFGAQQLAVGDRVLPLTLMESNLMRFLIQHEGQAVSRKTMLAEVWGVREDTDTRAIDNFIVRLRKYIEDDPARPRHLVTVRGLGYRFIAEP